MPRKSSEYRLRPELNVDQMSVRFDVVDSDDVVQESSDTFRFNALSDEFQKRTSLHGLNTLLQQRTSGTTIANGKLASMEEYYARLVAGEWAKERVGGPGVVSAEVEAVATLKKVSIPAAQKALKSLDEATRKKVLENPQVVKLAAEIKAKREAGAEVDLADLA